MLLLCVFQLCCYLFVVLYQIFSLAYIFRFGFYLFVFIVSQVLSKNFPAPTHIPNFIQFINIGASFLQNLHTLQLVPLLPTQLPTHTHHFPTNIPIPLKQTHKQLNILVIDILYCFELFGVVDGYML